MLTPIWSRLVQNSPKTQHFISFHLLQGMVEPGENVSVTLKREFTEEAMNALEVSEEEKDKIEHNVQDLFSKGTEVRIHYNTTVIDTDEMVAICRHHFQMHFVDWKLLSVYWHGLLGAVSIRKTVLPGMAIPMLKIRRPSGRLIFNMEIAIRR